MRIEILCQHNMSKSNFYRHNTGRAKLNSDHRNSIFAATAPRRGDKKSSRTFQRNFSEEKFLSGRPPARVRPLCAFGANSPTPALCGRKGNFRALRSATKGSAFGIRKPSRRLDPSFVSCGADWSFCQHNVVRANFCRIDMDNISVCTFKTS